jgi:hypothetical protein
MTAAPGRSDPRGQFMRPPCPTPTAANGAIVRAKAGDTARIGRIDEWRAEMAQCPATKAFAIPARPRFQKLSKYLIIST